VGRKRRVFKFEMKMKGALKQTEREKVRETQF
jgi:hypothetical protein